MQSILTALGDRRAAMQKEEGQKGFTLVELLVVVIIIGILAAIAIPVFLNQREGAWRGAAESDIKNAQIAAETYATAHNGSYSGLTPALLADNGYKATDGVVVKVPTATSTGYSLTSCNSNIDAGKERSFSYDSSAGKITGPAVVAACAP